MERNNDRQNIRLDTDNNKVDNNNNNNNEEN